MTYDIIISPTAEEDLKKFDAELQKQFFRKIEKIKKYPAIYGKPLRRPLIGRWELRFERRWRIIHIIDKEHEKVKIVAIWHKDEF